MIKDFLKHSLIYTIGNILVRGITFFLVPVYTRFLTPNDYGIIDAFAILTSLVNLTIALEISQAVPKFYQDTEDTEEKRNYVSTAFWFTVFVYVVFLIISQIYDNKFTQFLLDDGNLNNIFFAGSLSIVTNGIFYFAYNQLKWQILPKESVIVSCLNVILISAVSIFLLVYLKMKTVGVFIGQIVGYTGSSLLAIYFTRDSYSFKFDLNKLKKMLSFSTPLVFSSIAVFVSLYIDRIMIKNMLGFYELGIYGIAYRFASFSNIILVGFQNALIPLVYRHYKEEKTPLKISKIFNIFSILAIITVVGAIIFSEDIVFFLTTQDYYKSHSLIPILLIATFLANMYIFAPGLWIKQKTKLISFILIFGAIINFILNYLLIPMLGLLGAGIATLLSSIIVFFLQVYYGNKFYPIPYDKLKLLFCSASLIGISYLITIFEDKMSSISYLMKFFYLLVVGLTLIFLLLEKVSLKNWRKFFVFKKN